MPVRFVIEGLEELKAELRRLPRELAADGQAIVQRRAQRAGDTLRTAYAQHRHSGNLADHVTVSVTTSPFGVVATVKNTAPHAFIVEEGTATRHTEAGYNRGAMPPLHIFVPILRRQRFELYDEDLRQLLERAGLEVTGEP